VNDSQGRAAIQENLGGIANGAAESTPQGHVHDGSTTFCSLSVDGVINCAQCLSDTLYTIPEDIKESAHQLYHLLAGAGQDGLTKQALSEIHHTQLALTTPVFKALLESSPPLAYWTGYSSQSVSLVAASHIQKWSVLLSSRLVLPRRWIDMLGNTMQDIWEAACRAVVGTVSMRPGMTEADLRNRMRTVYDTCDLTEVLDHLVEIGALRRIFHLPDPTYPEELAPPHLTFLLVGPRGPWSL